jgi:transcriptional regulator with XRE-family HTH domain
MSKKKKQRSEEDKSISKYMGESIRNLRILRGLTQKQLAEKVDSGNTWISKIENGNENQGTSSKMLVRIAEVLHGDIVFIAKRDEGANNEKNK